MCAEISLELRRRERDPEILCVVATFHSLQAHQRRAFLKQSVHLLFVLLHPAEQGKFLAGRITVEQDQRAEDFSDILLFAGRAFEDLNLVSIW
jgi:hypothetical protein